MSRDSSTSSATTLVQRSLKYVWHPCTQMKMHEAFPLIPLAQGKGAWLYDTAGQRYLDAISSWWVNLFGHAHPRINAALIDQLSKLEHTMLAGFTHEPVVQLSENLSALTGHALGHCFYASDGASAVEIALKMSFHYWRNQGHTAKREFICLRQSYHGETLGALNVTDVALFRDAYAPLLHQAHIVLTPDAREANEGETAIHVAQRAIDDLEHLLIERSHTIAALIIEPMVQCATGMAMYDASYIQKARQLCDQYHVHLIADEIAVGCGRTGPFFACEHAAIWPDFLCLSKGISAGYLPLSLVMTSDAIYEAFYDEDIRRGFLHSHSYTGNPLACRAALASLEIFKTDKVLEHNQITSKKLRTLLEPLAIHPAVKHFRQCGMIFAFDAMIDEKKASLFSRQFSIAAHAQELLLRPIGKTVYLMPPYILTDAELEHLAHGTLNAFNQAIQHVSNTN